MALPAIPAIVAPVEEVEEISFEIPSGFAPPDTAEEGKPFDVTASVIMRDGRLVLNSINGAKLAAEEAEDDKMEEEEDMDEEETEDAGSLEDAMSAAGYM